jgi:hypothetical protein
MAQRYEDEDRRMRSSRSDQDERRSYGGNRGRSREQSFSGSSDRDAPPCAMMTTMIVAVAGGRPAVAGVFGDSEGHAEAARRGRSNR